MKLEEDLVCSIVLQSKYYGIVKSILRQVVDSSRIAYRDTASYFGILKSILLYLRQIKIA